MKVTLIGSNGLLSDSVGKYCNNMNFDLSVLGLNAPEKHYFTTFEQINLITNQPDYRKMLTSDVVIYAVGAGVQSNLNEDVELIYNLNVFVPVRICNELNKLNYNGTFITFGSYFEIGENIEEKKFSELELANSTRNVPNDYCVSKRMLTRFSISKKFKFNYIHSILPNIYGEYESSHRLIPYTIKAIKNGELLNFTSGNQVRQYLYIDDVPPILFALVTKKVSGVYNLSGNETYTVRQIVKKIFEFYNIEFNEKIFGSAQRVDVGMINLQIDGTKLHKELPDFEYSKFSECIKRYDLCL